MSEVKLSIGGREYTIACAEGEEDHVTRLGSEINEKLGQLGGSLSSSDAQNLLFGALFLADDLFETRKSADAAKAEFAKGTEEMAAAKREASLAVGQRDELKLTVSRLESELEGLQSAQQRHSAEVDDIRTELGLRREEAETATTEKKALVEKVALLTRERDNLMAQMANKDILLERANDMIQQNNAKPRTAPPTGAIGDIVQGTDLAPSLERFADLLENCADKLESAAQPS